MAESMGGGFDDLLRSDRPALFAMSALVPVLAFQRLIIRGVALGALKR